MPDTEGGRAPVLCGQEEQGALRRRRGGGRQLGFRAPQGRAEPRRGPETDVSAGGQGQV